MSNPHRPPIEEPAPLIFRHNPDDTIDILCRPCDEVLVAGFDDSPAHRELVKAHQRAFDMRGADSAEPAIDPEDLRRIRSGEV